MEITILGLFTGFLLLAVPVYVIYRFRLRMISQLILAFVKMAVSLFLTGIFLKYVFQMDSCWLNILWMVLLAMVASWAVIRKARLKQKRFLIPVGTGVLLATAVVGLYLLFLTFGVHQPFAARYWIPVTGLLIGSMIQTNASALSTYYMGLRHHRQLYLYLTGNGATHREAVAYFVKRALERNMKPAISEMGYMMVSVCPVILWAMILAGEDLLTAVGCQILILIASFCASTLSLVITLLVARRYLFDDYERLKQESIS